ncbi:MAG: VWA domain-containing protein [Verrucomicrobia bacterium]|nr:VWA domain-containing protein [Verrucomicrobiota bacterium]
MSKSMFEVKRKEEGGVRGLLEVSLGDEEHVVAMPAMEPPAIADEKTAVLAGVAVGASKPFNTEAYAYQADNAYMDVAGNPLSTFSIDVDSAGYSNMRRFIQQGQRPPRDAVRIEEMVNYFPYNYTAPKDDKPFAASMEVASAPWNPQHRLVRIGLKGREIAESARPALNLVFLLDVSGSMNEPNKLPLVKESMKLLVEKLKPTDRVAIAVYAGASGLALPSTSIEKKQEILAAIDALTPGGSTNGAMGIQLAYDIAKANFVKDGANRVVLCTDGDFNIGVTNQGDLTRLIEEKAKSGVFLTVLGFGMGNYKDDTLEKLADKGNGNYGYVDNFAEAKKLLVNQLSGTLVTIAKDVKIQVEFNPALVKSYRLIGYENRMLKKEDFNNDKIDAGEIGAGHTVTALYEVVPVGVDSPSDVPAVDALKYQSEKKAKLAKVDGSAEMLTLKVRYKAPASDVSSKLEFPLMDSGSAFAAASQDFKFAAAVASFGMMLRESPHKGVTSFDAVLGWAEDGFGKDTDGYRREFMELVKKTKSISG